MGQPVSSINCPFSQHCNVNDPTVTLTYWCGVETVTTHVTHRVILVFNSTLSPTRYLFLSFRRTIISALYTTNSVSIILITTMICGRKFLFRINDS